MNSSQQADSSPAGPQPLKCVHYLDAVREEAGGVVRAVLDLVQAVSDAGAEVTLLTADPTDVPAEWRAGQAGCPQVVTITRRMTPWFSLTAADRSTVETVLTGADVLHLHTPWDPYNLALAATARQLRVPYVVSIHGMLDDWSMSGSTMKKQVFLALAGRRMLERAFRIHLTAEDERRQAMKWAPKGTASVLPLVMDLSPYENLPGPEIAQSTFPALGKPGAKLLFLSRVHPKKGVERLLDAVVKLRARGNQVEALVAGPGEAAYVAEMKQIATDHGVGDHVHFLGMVRGDAKLSLYQACDLFVLPTSQENFGIVLTEAMACGTPIVTTQGVDIWRELEERGATIVDRDGESIATAIDALLADAEALKARGEKSRQGVFQWLDPQTVTAGYMDLYHEAAKQSQ